MILRKPYAMLIKYFKLIHIIMFFFFAYLVFVIRKIYLFFSEYVKTSNFTYFEDMTSRYIPIIVFFMIILILGLAIGVFLLMRKKDKPVLFYKLLITYCVILLAVFIYFFAFFKSLDSTVYEPLRIVVNRDIILFLYIINFFFVGFSFIRGFGFDITKFSFDKDKKELNLEESDSEEYELNVKLEKEDVKNFLNRQKREFKYYLKENALVLSIIAGVIIIGLGISLYLNFFVINKVYKEKEEISISDLVYVVNSSYVTNVDKYGKASGAKNDYLVVNFNILNTGSSGYLDSQSLRVHIDNEYYYPSSITCDLFDDLGECYKNQQIKSKDNHNYIVVYRIKTEHKKIYMEILKEKGAEYKYSKVLLDYKTRNLTEENYKLNETFTIKDSSHQINSYEITDKTSYEYQECVEDKCSNYTKTVSPRIGDITLVLDISDLDKLSDDFLKSAIGLRHENKTIYGNNIKLIDRHDNKVYLSVSNSVKNADKLTLVITTREKKYNILLKGE